VEDRTAGPSTTLRSVGMTILFEGWGWHGKFGRSEGRIADPSTALRFGRDDKGESGASIGSWIVEDRTADPSASLGMTKGSGASITELSWRMKRSTDWLSLLYGSMMV
jgi:hypothetical protein